MVARTAIGLVAIWLLAAPPARAQSWSAPVTLSAQPAGASWPATAVGADGTAAVVWAEVAGADQPSNVLVSIRPAGGAFGAPVQLSAMGHERGRPAVAVGPTGTVLVVWVDDDDPNAVSNEFVRAAVWTPAGGFGMPYTVMHGARMHGAPAAAYDAGGVATVAWAEDDAAYAARRQANGEWSSTQMLRPIDQSSVQRVTLAVAANGDAALSWDGWMAVREGPHEPFGVPQPFSTTRDQKLAMAPDGRAIAYWPDGEETMAADRAPNGGFGAPYELIARGYGTGVAFGPDSRAHAVCMCSAGGEHDRVQRRERAAGGAWGEPLMVADPAEHGGASGERGPVAAADAAGTLYFAWHGTDFATLQDTILAGTVPGPGPAPVPSLQSVSHSPTIAAGPAGVVVLAWRSAAGIEAAWWTGEAPTEPPPPPPPADVQAPNHTPAFQGGPARAGRIAGAGVTAPLEPAWTVDTGRASQGALLAGGRVFLRGGGVDRPVIAYDVRSGGELWRRPVARYAVYDHLAFADEKVFVAGHETFALDAATGADVWHSPASGEWPVVDGGRLLMADPGSAVAISTADGAQLWENPTGSEGGAVSTGLGRAFRAGSNSAVAFDLLTGARAWRQSAGSSGFNQMPAAFDGAWMWVTGGGDNRAYDMRTGLVTTLSPAGGFVAISAPLGYQVRERALVAFDLRTLEVRWQLPLPYGSHLSATAPLVVDDLVLIATGGRFYAADRHTGALRWSGELSATQSTEGGLAAGDGHIVVPTVRGADVFRTASAPVEGPVSLPTVPTASPLPSQPRARPTLRGRARLSGRRLVVTVSMSARATGKVVISAGRRSVTRRLVRGATRVTIRLRARERPRRITVRYGGDARYLPVRRTLRT